MAASSPKKADLILGLTPSEAKLIILGVVSANEPPKVDMNKLAEKGGYKPGSASVLYNKAKRKLFELHGDGANGGTANTAGDANPALGPSGDDIGTPATPTPKKTPSRRKRDNATATPAKGTPTNAESTAETPVKTEVDPETPKPKRQRKTPAKKGRGAATESNGADGEASQGTSKDNTTTAPRIKPEPNVNVETELNGDDDDPLGAELETELGSDIVKGEYDEMFDANTMDAAPTTSNA